LTSFKFIHVELNTLSEELGQLLLHHSGAHIFE
jgi:hypothetical protein